MLNLVLCYFMRFGGIWCLFVNQTHDPLKESNIWWHIGPSKTYRAPSYELEGG